MCVRLEVHAMERFALWLCLVVLIPSSVAAGSQEASLASLDRQIAALNAEGRYGDAIPLAKKAVDLAVATYGAESTEAAFFIQNLGVLYEKRRVRTGGDACQ